MYNYLRELHRLFNKQPDCPKERQQLDQDTAEFQKRLEAKDRKLLLRILDTRDVIAYESSLESFAAGFRLAYGVTRELESNGGYSYEESETERICQTAEHRTIGGG